MFQCRYFRHRLCFCLGLRDLYETNTLKTKFEKSSRLKKANFFPGQKYWGRFFSTATVFWFATFNNQAQNGGR